MNKPLYRLKATVETRVVIELLLGELDVKRIQNQERLTTNALRENLFDAASEQIRHKESSVGFQVVAPVITFGLIKEPIPEMEG